MSITINGATNTLTAASGLTIAGNTAVTGTLSATGRISGQNMAADYNSANAGSGYFLVKNSGGADGMQVGWSSATYTTGGGLPWVLNDSPYIYVPAGKTLRVGISNVANPILEVSSTGLAVTGTLSATGITSVTDTTEATSTTAASLKTAGGLAVAKKLYVGGNVSVPINTAFVAAAAANGLSYFGATGTQAQLAYNRIISSGSRPDATQSVAFVQLNGGAGASDVKIYTAAVVNTEPSVTATFSPTALTLGTGVNLVMASGKGIDFSATANGSGTTTSEVLSDYEEGSWTPTIEGTTSAGVGTYSDRTGGYTKVGRLVTFYSTLAWSAHTGTGDLKLTGLPFVCNSAQRGSCTVESSGLTATNPLGRVEISDSSIIFVEMVSATRVALDTSVTYVFLAGHYFV